MLQLLRTNFLLATNVRPLLKKPTLDPSDLNSYRPISNLSFVSKILERLIDCRIADHANRHGLFSPVQSAENIDIFAHHSTETALVKIHNDLVGRVDTGHVGAIALLDLSSASSTIWYFLTCSKAVLVLVAQH